MLGNEVFFDASWEVVFDRPTMSVDLSGGLEAAFAGAHARNHRRDAAQARRAGLVTALLPCTPDTLDQFARMYWETMTRLEAGSDYFFSRIYFKTLAERFAQDISIAEVRDTPDGQTLSAAADHLGIALGALPPRRAERYRRESQYLSPALAFRRGGSGAARVAGTASRRWADTGGG
ncbi:MAG: hypothetical protein WDN28_28150 [Chthoniobacter sp.]